MDIDWIFLNQNNSVIRETLETEMPHIGDGRNHNGVGYEVIFVGSNLISRTNPVVLAVQHR